MAFKGRSIQIAGDGLMRVANTTTRNGVGQLTASRLYRDLVLKKNHLTGIFQVRKFVKPHGGNSPITLRLPLRSVLGTETARVDTAIG